MTTILIVIHVIVSLFLICIVLLQHGKGADIGATFGGSSQSLFGTEGPLPLLNKITTAAAVVFMTTSVTLAYISAHKSSGSVMSKMPVAQEQTQGAPERTTTAPPPVMPTTETAAPPQSNAPATPKAEEAAPGTTDGQVKDKAGQNGEQSSTAPAEAAGASAQSQTTKAEEAAASAPPAQETAAPQAQEKEKEKQQ